jgi:probable HAF family extracellular repeat protein
MKRLVCLSFASARSLERHPGPTATWPWRRWTAVASGLALVIAVAASVNAQSTWRIIDLGTLRGPYAGLWNINNNGIAVGWSRVDEGRPNEVPVVHAIRWSMHEGMRDLGTLPGTSDSYAWGINDAGDIVGQSGRRAFLWTSPGGMVDIGSLSNITGTTAEAVNSARTVVGTSSTTAGQRAFIWTPAHGMRDLGTLGGNASGANDINDAGQVVGWANPMSSDYPVDYHAFLWSPTGGMIDLDPLGGNSTAYRVNNRGEVVGYREVGASIHGFLWTAAGGMVDLGESQATGLNDLTQVVGGDPPYVWTSSGGRMLLPTLPPVFGLTGLPRDINNHRLVVGYHFAPGGSHAVLWCESRPPVITSTAGEPDVLWPPNHQMITVRVNYTATGSCGAAVTTTISAVSSEADNGIGDANFPNDIVIVDPRTVLLRAERSGRGNGRVYTMTIRAVDQFGLETTADVTVTVPKSMRGTSFGQE